jgi:hypothetical protein
MLGGKARRSPCPDAGAVRRLRGLATIFGEAHDEDEAEATSVDVSITSSALAAHRKGAR